MSVLTRSIRWLVFAAATITSSWVSAQGYHPFAEPLEFDPDWQWFAPVQLQDFEELTSKQRARHGWYGAYDRVRQGFNRSETEAQSGKVDFTWGNRFDFGFMGERDHGWNFSFMNVSGPNTYNEIYQNRLNAFDSNDDGDPTDPYIPRDWQNDPQYRERVYFVRDSLNAGSYSSFEANKTWRTEPYRYGGILEPMVGLRFSKFDDIAENDTYDSFGVDTDLDGTADLAREIFLQDVVTTSNQMLLGQVGFRYIKYTKRWTLSSDFKTFFGHNFQTQHLALYSRTTDYPNPVVIGQPPSFTDDKTGTSFNGRNNDEFVVGMDLRTEAAYTISKAIDIRAGFNLLYFGTGVWRGATTTSGGNQFLQNQNLVMPGFTFGFAINR